VLISLQLLQVVSPSFKVGSFACFPTMSSLLLPLLISSVVVARQVHISVDASSSMGVLPPVARFFGADVSTDESQTLLTMN